ncbi:arsenite methyltransferase [Christensenellaceae bacterium OttesenSCG-928-K19]|nr:arsenite methyltransferase [Christensenellaceae bacterium OttesenSCG-928-K19]
MSKDHKSDIKEYYGGLAARVSAESKQNTCCSSASESVSCCCQTDNLYTAEYIKDVPVEALNASMGCANPIFLANIQKGETVLDLGSGGGIDVLISAKYTGKTGKVYGLDMTDEMLALANENKKKSGAGNVEFLKGYIEDIPLDDNMIDVVTSNCVINLSEDKGAVLKEAYRVLKPGGRIALADVVELKEVRADLRENAQLWVGCISGALSIEDYTQKLKDAGFKDIDIQVVEKYTTDFLKSFAESNNFEFNLSESDIANLDNAFASAYVKASK